MPPGAVYVGRPTRWGNPFEVGMFSGRRSATGRPLRFLTLAEVVEAHRDWITGKRGQAWERPDLAPLRGHDLACWCPPDQPCHADVLLDLANVPILQPALTPTSPGTPWDRSPGGRPWTDKRTWPARASVTD